MTKRAAVFGSLIDLRNIAAHKCVRLVVEVPAEQAAEIVAMFGWPTAVSPVPVALARMNDVLPPLPAEPPPKSLARQVGALCANPIFWAYLTRYEEYCGFVVVDEATCASFVRWHCGVTSRSEIKAGTSAGDVWLDLLEEFHGWEAAEKSGVEMSHE